MALFPKVYKDSLVSVEVLNSKQDGTLPIASAFLFGAKIDLQDEKGKQRYLPFLVTNKHVFEKRKEVYLRFNAAESYKTYLTNLIDESGKKTWFNHADTTVDLAILPLKGKIFGRDKINYFLFTDDNYIFLSSDFEKNGISSGDGVFVLGFPMGLRGEDKNQAIVRRGIISRYDDETFRKNYFYIDAPAYPGNSGGPVITKPELIAIEGTKSVSQSKLIGVVSEGLTYTDVAISAQTGRARISFEEQTGLVKVVPVDAIVDIIKPFVINATSSIEKIKEIRKDTEEITKEAEVGTTKNNT